MRIPPPSVEATWPTPNYVDPVTRGPLLLRVEAALLSLSFIIVVLRVYVRGFLIRNIGSDDWLILAAMVPTIGLTVAVCLAAQRFSWNVHIWDLPPTHLVPLRKISWAAQMIFIFATVLTKLSLLSMILRIAHTKTFRYVIYGTMVATALYIPVFVLLLVFQCSPISDYWNVLNPQGSCINELAPLIASCAYNLALDMWIYMLPMPTLWKVELPLRQRLSLVAIFAMGSLVVIGGVFRIYWVWYVIDATYDITWNGFTLWMWTAVEINLGIICASLPTLKPLASRFLDLRSTSQRYGYTDRPSANTRQASAMRGKSPANVDEIALRSMDVASSSWEIKALPPTPEVRSGYRRMMS